MPKEILTLGTLPIELLQLITNLLKLEDLTNLVVLSGNSALYSKCVALGGVCSVTATSNRSVQLLRHCPQYQLLNSLHVKAPSDASTNLPPIVRSVIEWLPPTMTVIEIEVDEPLLTLFRPLTDADDDLTRLSLSHLGLTPINMAKRFPSLYTLWLEGICHSYFPNATIYRLLQDLPPSITCLHMPGGFNTNCARPVLPNNAPGMHSSSGDLIAAPAPPMWLQQVSNLTWSIHGFSTYSFEDAMFAGNAERPLEEMIFCQNLVSLNMSVLASPQSLNYLAFFTRLESLRLTLNYRLMRYRPVPLEERKHLPLLPSSLTRLQTQLLNDCDIGHVLSKVPKLKELDLTIESLQSPNNAECVISYFPPLLQSLRLVRLEDYSEIRSAIRIDTPLPTTLTALLLHAITNSALDLRGHSALQTLQLHTWEDVVDDTFPSKPSFVKHTPLYHLPPSLKCVILTARSANEALTVPLLQRMPKSLTEIRGLINISNEMEGYRFYHGHTTWHRKEMKERVRALYAPHIPPQNFHLQPVGTAYARPEAHQVKGIKFDKMESYEDWMPGDLESPNYLVLFAANTFPAAMTRLSTKYSGIITHVLSNKGPPGLTHLGIGRFDEGLKEPALPSTLRSLAISLTSAHYDLVRELFSQISLLPQLTKLYIDKIPAEFISRLLHLPSSIIDLNMTFLPKKIGQSDDYLLAADWLHNLRHLTIKGVEINARNFVPRLGTLESLTVDCIVLEGESFPLLSSIGQETPLFTIDGHNLRDICLKTLPSRLRNGLGTTFRVDWTSSTLSRLPRNMTSLELTEIPEKPKWFQAEQAQMLPPAITTLRLSNYINHDVLPHLPTTITELSAPIPTLAHDSTIAFPPKLKTLALRNLFFGISDTYAALKNLFTSLPLCLLHLTFVHGFIFPRQQPTADEKHVFTFLPDQLLSFSLAADWISDIQCVAHLPKTITYLCDKNVPDNQQLGFPQQLKRVLPALRFVADHGGRMDIRFEA